MEHRNAELNRCNKSFRCLSGALRLRCLLLATRASEALSDGAARPRDRRACAVNGRGLLETPRTVSSRAGGANGRARRLEEAVKMGKAPAKATRPALRPHGRGLLETPAAAGCAPAFHGADAAGRGRREAANLARRQGAVRPLR